MNIFRFLRCAIDKQLSPDFHEKMQIKGNLHIELRDKDGKLRDERFIHNVVCALGDAYVAECVTDNTATYMGWMAVGTGADAGATPTALTTENDRNALTSTTQGTGGDDNDVIYVGDWAAGDATAAITEAGIFAAASAGTMFVYSYFSVINKGASDTLKITWTLTLGST